MPDIGRVTQGAAQLTPDEKKQKTSKTKKILKNTMIVGLSLIAAATIFVGGLHTQKFIIDKEPAQIEEQLPGDSTENEKENGGNENQGNENSGNENSGNENQGGENQGGENNEQTTPEDVLTLEEQTAIASKIFSGSRAEVSYDAASINIEGVKEITEGEEKYLEAYISLTEEGQNVLYKVGYTGITTEAEIPNAEVRKVREVVADIEKYVSIENYITEETAQAEAIDCFETHLGVEELDNVYVKVDKKTRRGQFSATVEYIATDAENIYPSDG